MNCDEAKDLMSSQLDGEISPADAACLQQHLESCATCRAEMAEWSQQHDSLRKGFAWHQAAAKRIGDDVLAELRRRPIVRRDISWWSLVAAAAAGFALACVITWPWERNAPMVAGPATRANPGIGHVTVAGGRVEWRPSTDQGWSALTPSAPISAGSQIRTGPGVRCEVALGEGSQLRVDQNTNITLVSNRQFDLTDGRVWSCVSRPAVKPFQANSGHVLFTAIGTQVVTEEASVVVPDFPVQFDLAASKEGVTLTVLHGSVQANGDYKESGARSGQQLLCPDGHLGQPQPVHNLETATNWLNDILILKGRDNPELNKRIDDLFAQIGATKMDFMYEDEIRGLGDHCVLPLVRYIESDRSADQEYKRALAAKIVSDVAQPWAIPELLGLLNDHNGDVRASAATALHRLTGQTLGRTADAWRSDSLFQCAPTTQSWQQWWQQNHENYPGASSTTPVVADKRMPLNKS